tara:strand:- start:86 stop:358 length:273 start_codon:yes stop_codon:yes gene_type:complete
MPVFDHRRTPIKDLPDEVCIVLRPTQNPDGTGQEYQSGSINIDTYGIVGYLPVYNSYLDALKENPNSHIYMLNLTEYKKELGLVETEEPI